MIDSHVELRRRSRRDWISRGLTVWNSARKSDVHVPKYPGSNLTVLKLSHELGSKKTLKKTNVANAKLITRTPDAQPSERRSEKIPSQICLFCY